MMSQSGDGIRATERKGVVVQLPLPRGHADVLASLRAMISGPSAVVPFMPTLLRNLWPEGHPPPPADLVGVVDNLVHRGYLRCVVVGCQRHLALPSTTGRGTLPSTPPDAEKVTSAPSPPETGELVAAQAPDAAATEDVPTASFQPLPIRSTPPDGGSTHHPEQTVDSERAFELQLRVDAETERVLLYRVGVVILALGGLTLLREWAMWLYHL